LLPRLLPFRAGQGRAELARGLVPCGYRPPDAVNTPRGARRHEPIEEAPLGVVGDWTAADVRVHIERVLSGTWAPPGAEV
jgi:hypothetical protein